MPHIVLLRLSSSDLRCCNRGGLIMAPGDISAAFARAEHDQCLVLRSSSGYTRGNEIPRLARGRFIGFLPSFFPLTKAAWF